MIGIFPGYLIETKTVQNNSRWMETLKKNRRVMQTSFLFSHSSGGEEFSRLEFHNDMVEENGTC